MSGKPRRLALLVAYRGDAFHGFQRQAGSFTVQEALEAAWSSVTGEAAVMHGSGRTDAGVHAWGQVVHFSTWSALPPERVREALNAYLCEQVVVRAAAEVEADFHARASAIAKHYIYRIAVSPTRPVLANGLAHWQRTPLDLDAMREAAGLLRGRHDFRAFAAAGRPLRDATRTLTDLRIMVTRGGFLVHARGNGFLYRMVRNLAGTLIEVGRGRRAPQWAAAVLESRDRRRAGATAPPEGLLMWRVHYRRDPFAALPRQAARPYPEARPAPRDSHAGLASRP